MVVETGESTFLEFDPAQVSAALSQHYHRQHVRDRWLRRLGGLALALAGGALLGLAAVWAEHHGLLQLVTGLSR